MGRVVSAERGTTATVVCAMGAGGQFVPPCSCLKERTWTTYWWTAAQQDPLWFHRPADGWIAHCSLNIWSISLPQWSPQSIILCDISPYPQVSTTSGRKRRAEISCVLTSTPYKAALEEKVAHRKGQPRNGTRRFMPKSSKKLFSASRLNTDVTEPQQPEKELKSKKLRATPSQHRDKSTITHSTKLRPTSKSPCLSIKKLRAASERKELPRLPVWLQKQAAPSG